MIRIIAICLQRRFINKACEFFRFRDSRLQPNFGNRRIYDCQKINKEFYCFEESQLVDCFIPKTYSKCTVPQ